MRKRYGWAALAGACIAILSASACGKSAEQGRAEAASNVENQIKAIQENPNMPEQAKAVAIHQLRTRTQQGPAAPSGK